MRLGYLGIALVYLAVAGMEVTFHWYVGMNNSAEARRLQEWYLERDPDNKKRYHEGFVDFIVPTMILAVAAGVIGRQWPPRQLVFCVLLLSFGLMALYPLYDMLVPQREPVWVGANLGNRVQFLLFGIPRMLSFCGVLVYGARYFTQDSKNRPIRAERTAIERKAETEAQFRSGP